MVAVGLMSGTSLDGVDAALVRIEGPTHATLLDFITRPYDEAERSELRAALDRGARAEPAAFARLHVRLADWAADAVQILLAQSRTQATEVIATSKSPRISGSASVTIDESASASPTPRASKARRMARV